MKNRISFISSILAVIFMIVAIVLGIQAHTQQVKLEETQKSMDSLFSITAQPL